MAALPAPDLGVARADQLVLRAAVSAYLGRYRGETLLHTESDLRVFLRWCTDHGLDPLAAVRADIERYVRWLQDVRRYQPSTVSRRLSVVVGFYRVCVIDQILPHSPAESPTLGLGHLQFEALITTARLSANPNDFALIALLGLLGLRIFEACGARNTATGSCECAAKAARSCSFRCHPRWPEPSTGPSTTAPTGRSCATPTARGWTATPPPAGSSTWPRPPESVCRGCTRTC
ncbi:MAG: integrase/recombinase XerD [Micromonosporaceae bacterium]|nr:integrase/recombinase XerD [Micromonosporaceae bacterium]